MDKTIHPYKKLEGNRDLEPIQKRTVPTSPIQNIEVKKQIPYEYSKPEGTTPLPTFLVIFSGGEGRERNYFSLIEKNKAKFQRIKMKGASLLINFGFLLNIGWMNDIFKNKEKLLILLMIFTYFLTLIILFLSCCG